MSDAAGSTSSQLVMEKFKVNQFSYQNTTLVIPENQTLKSEFSDLEITAYFLHRVLQMPNPKTIYEYFRTLPKVSSLLSSIFVSCNYKPRLKIYYLGSEWQDSLDAAVHPEFILRHGIID